MYYFLQNILRMGKPSNSISFMPPFHEAIAKFCGIMLPEMFELRFCQAHVQMNSASLLAEIKLLLSHEN